MLQKPLGTKMAAVFRQFVHRFMNKIMDNLPMVTGVT